MSLVPHLWQALQLTHIEARLTFGPEPRSAPDRKQLAAELWQAVEQVFEPMADPAEIERLETLRHSDPDLVPPILRPRRRSGSSGV